MNDETPPQPDFILELSPAFPLVQLVGTLAKDHQMDANKIEKPIQTLVTDALIYWNTEQSTPHSKDDENAAKRVRACARKLIDAINDAPNDFVPLTNADRTRLVVILDSLRGLTKDQRRGDWLVRWLVGGLSGIATACAINGVGRISRGERVSFIVDAINWLFGPNEEGSLRLLAEEVEPSQVSAILYREVENPE